MTLATDYDAVQEYARNVGAENTDQAWILDPRDVWVRNPHYTGPAVPHPEDDMPEPTEDGLFLDPAAALTFILGGRATITIRSAKTGTRYTYKISRAKDNPRMFFVSALTGPDNEVDYQYIGFFKTMLGTATQGVEKIRHDTRTGLLIAGKKGKPSDIRFRGLDYVLRKLADGEIPADAEIWHEGRCCRCNRKLTTPESIRSGIGPECAKKG